MAIKHKSICEDVLLSVSIDNEKLVSVLVDDNPDSGMYLYIVSVECYVNLETAQLSRPKMGIHLQGIGILVFCHFPQD